MPVTDDHIECLRRHGRELAREHDVELLEEDDREARSDLFSRYGPPSASIGDCPIFLLFSRHSVKVYIDDDTGEIRGVIIPASRSRRRQNPNALHFNPAPQAFNYYINWAIYAIYGMMGNADDLMRKHGAQIRSVARALRKKIPIPSKKLYRGILLEPDQIDNGVIEQLGDVTFVSFTEDRDVACWFADRQSIMSSFVAEQRPDVEGWIMEYKPSLKEVLYHWRWKEIPVPGGSKIPLIEAAEMHPHIDPAQFEWNMRTQKEVMVEPLKAGQSVMAHELSDCPPTRDLDERFTAPMFR